MVALRPGPPACRRRALGLCPGMLDAGLGTSPAKTLQPGVKGLGLREAKSRVPVTGLCVAWCRCGYSDLPQALCSKWQ